MTFDPTTPAPDAGADAPEAAAAPHADATSDATRPAVPALDPDDLGDDDVPPDSKEGATDGAAGFAALGLRAELAQALAALGYEEPTPIQAEAIPVLLGGGDVLGLAATGTGKTAAFALPLLQRIEEPLPPAPADAAGDAEAAPAEGDAPRALRGPAHPRPRGPRDAGTPAALVLVPTRELAMQVAEAVHKYGRALGVRVLAVYGGAAMTQQLRALSRGVDVVVATPGRALDFLNRGTLRLDAVRMLVLDEADEMLDMGFEEDLTAIVGATPRGRQTALFSATMAPRVARIADAYLTTPARVEIRRKQLAEGEMPKVKQSAYVVPRVHKPATLARVLDVENPTSAIVFCRTRGEVDELTESLAARGWRAEALHGGMGQEARDRVMRRFRANQIELLIATDVAARGLDVEHVSHVVNYDVPIAPEQYVHRIGRTGRAGREGVAITIAEPREQRLLRTIERVTRQPLHFATVPTPADVRERRLARTGGAVREVLAAARAEQFEAAQAAARGDDGEDGELPSTSLDAFRVVVESLADEFEPLEIAAAAIRVAHEAAAGDVQSDETEIPSVLPRDERGARGSERSARGNDRFGARGDRPERGDRGDRGDRPARSAGGAARGGPSVKLWVSVGRDAGLRPGDLMGAIVNEAGIAASDVGMIDIAPRFALVEVPESAADDVITALSNTRLKGERPSVRRDREGGEGGGFGGRESRGGFGGRGGDRGDRGGDRGARIARAYDRTTGGDDATEGGPRGERASFEREHGRLPREARETGRFERPAGGEDEGEAGGGARERRPSRHGFGEDGGAARFARPARGGFDRGDRGGDRGERGFDRGPRPGGFDRGPRPGGFDRGPRPGGFDRGDRPQGGGRFERGGDRPERPARSGFDRGERPQGGGERGFDRGPRPGGFDRGPRPGGFDRGPRPGGFDRGDRPQGGFDRGGDRPSRGPRPFDRGERGGFDRGDRSGGSFRGPRRPDRER